MSDSPFKIPHSCETATWETDRWGKRDSDRWPEAFQKPRSCSYCGSVHPDDVIALIEQGWEFDPSTKSYKSYWNPPGHAAHTEDVLANLDNLDKIGEPQHVSPVPPVKLYHNHLSPDQLANINSLLLIRNAKKGGAA